MSSNMPVTNDLYIRCGLFLRMFLVMLILLTQGCAILSTGHTIDRSKLDSIKPGKTRGEDVIRMLGKPDVTLHKIKEGTSVWTYKSITTVAVGILVPFFSLMKGKTTGLQLNIGFDKTDTVVEVEILEMEEYLFSPG